MTLPLQINHCLLQVAQLRPRSSSTAPSKRPKLSKRTSVIPAHVHQNPFSQPSFFPIHAIHHAFAGIGANTVAVLCMNPVDLFKVNFQLPSIDALARGRYRSRYLARFLKWRATGDASLTDRPLSASQYLLISAGASAVTAILFIPIWVVKPVKIRTFTAPPHSPAAHRGLWNGFRAIFHDEGFNGALQFMGYEKMKGWAFERKQRRVAKLGRAWTTDDEKLLNTSYTVMSGASKLGASCTTYPYQFIRSRMQTVLMRCSAGALTSSYDYVDHRAYIRPTTGLNTFFSVDASAVTVILTNPIWVVKVRTFTAPPNSPAAHRGLWSTSLDFFGFLIHWPVGIGGFCAILHEEGCR
ncbi:Mitochondrial carrier domain containing protein [Lactarius tabidus]